MQKANQSRVAILLRTIIGFDQARGRDPEIEQAWLRVGIATLGFAWCWYLVLQEGEITHGLAMAMSAAGIAAAVGIGMIAALRRDRSHAISLRYLGILTDTAAVSLGMAGADEGGVAMIGVYLWVTVGNGFRFGPKYLLAAYWLSLLGLGLQLIFVPFWIQHRAIGAGLLLALAVVPLYVLVLLSRLTAQKDAAEQLSNAKSRFVANVSHELRTPLTGIRAVYDLLRKKPHLSNEDRELVGMLGSAISTLKYSVDAVLQMSKLEAGAEVCEVRSFNLIYFLNQIAKSFRPQLAAKRLTWNRKIDADVPTIVRSDPEHLFHVLSNLLNNAIKFTEVGEVSLRVARRGDVVRFEIADTGIGIPPDQQGRLFDRFVQVDGSASRRHGGTGLGTSIARDLVQLMGGRIGVESVLGKGTTFWIELPCITPAPEIENNEQSEFRGKVFLVGARTQSVSTVGGLIRTLGISVTTADTIKALPPKSQLQESSPCVIVSSSILHGNSRALAELAALDCPWLVLGTVAADLDWNSLTENGMVGAIEPNASQATVRSMLAALSNQVIASAIANEDQPSSEVSAHRILLADDNKGNQILLSQILRDAGHSVVTAERGDKAFDIMIDGGIEAAILDLNMPDMTGPDIVKLYRAASIGAKRLPIMILSADATPTARQESLTAGADAFLTKPVSSAALIAAVDCLFSRTLGDNSHTTPEMQDSSATQELLDADRMTSLNDVARGDARFLKTYFLASFEDIERALFALRSAIDSGESRPARDALHIIEGTGASIGGKKLVHDCRVLRGVLMNARECESTFAELSTSYALIKSAILAQLSARDNLEVSDLEARGR